MLTVILQILGALYAFAAPGALVAMQLDTDWSRPVQVAVGVALGVLTIPMLSFCTAWILGTSVTPAIVFGVATVANAVAGGLWFAKRRGGRAGA